MFLKQSTSQDIRIGPFLDSTDGDTEETGLTIANTDVRLSKDGGNMAAKNSGGLTHDENGWYSGTLDATDTDTVGELDIYVHVSGALAVWKRYWVLEEVIYDALFAASAAAFDSNQRMDVGSWLGTAVTLGNGAPDVNVASKDDIDLSATEKASVNAECDTALTDYDGVVPADLNDPTAATIADAVWDEARSGHVAAGSFGEGVLVESLNTQAKADVNAQADTALADYDAVVPADLNDPTAAAIADAVWDEARSGHVSAGTFGEGVNAEALNTQAKADVNAECDTALADYDAVVPADLNDPTAAAIADAVWDEATGDHTTSGTTGEAAGAIGADGSGLVEAGGTGDQFTEITDDLPVRVTRNVAISNFPLFMVDATDFATPETGLTVSGSVSKDGGSFSVLSNSVTEIANGWYKVNITAAEMNADVVLLRFTATGAADRNIAILTQPT